MPTIFQPRESGKSRQIRLSLPDVEADWLEAQAQANGLTIHEAATQVVRFAREESNKPAEPPKPARKARQSKTEASL